MARSHPSALIVGGGLSGLLMAMFLARTGVSVTVMERRPDVRTIPVTRGRRINLLFSARGLAALRELGLEEEVTTRLCVPIYGRMVHSVQGQRHLIPYSKSGREPIHICPRADLNAFLVEKVEKTSGVRLLFNERCVAVDKDTATAEFVNETTKRRTAVTADFIIGADGTYSVVREFLLKGELADYQQIITPWRSKEIVIPAGESGPALEQNASHAWPRGRHLLFALPNRDGSFNCTMILPLSGPESVEELRTEDDVAAFLQTHYGSVPMPPGEFLKQYQNTKPSMFPTIRTGRWHHRDKVVLIGDSCHTVVPFYGQGMNAAFEDCLVLAECLNRHGADRAAAFDEYVARRRPHTDVLSDLSLDHFSELVDPEGQPVREMRRRLTIRLNALVGQSALSLYAMVAHTTMPYQKCVDLAVRNERRARWLGLDLFTFGYRAWFSARNLLRRLVVRGGRDRSRRQKTTTAQ